MYDVREMGWTVEDELAYQHAAEVARRGIRCGHCHGRHESVTAVYACSIMHTAGVVTTR
jgi:hypothetical protein